MQSNFQSLSELLKEFVLDHLDVKPKGGIKSQIIQTDHVERLIVFAYKIIVQYCLFPTTVEPVLSGPVLSGHPLLSGQLSKSRKLLPLITVILTSIKRSLVLSGRGHPLLSPDELFLLS